MSHDPRGHCPRCGVVREDGPECPRCGVIYAKARPWLASPEAGDGTRSTTEGAEVVTAAPVPLPLGGWSGKVVDARRELLVRAVAPPAALVIAWVLVSSHAGHALVRTFLSMWVHELGHAATAWFCGYGAFPGPWVTPVSPTRVPFVVAALAGVLGTLAWRGWRARRGAVAAAAAAGLVAQLVCTLMPANAARALITFGGDGGAMVLGAALFATIWTDPEGPLGRGSLRWGLLGIGAAALVDALDTWLRAWRDHGQLPLGEIEGVGLSDASTLMEVHGWSAGALAGRYTMLGITALATLAVVYAIALSRARARWRAAESEVLR